MGFPIFPWFSPGFPIFPWVFPWSFPFKPQVSSTDLLPGPLDPRHVVQELRGLWQIGGAAAGVHQGVQHHHTHLHTQHLRHVEPRGTTRNGTMVIGPRLPR